MKSTAFFIILIFISSFSAFSQRIVPSVFASGGNHVKKNNISFSYTIGELFVPTYKNKRIITQGFQQSQKIITGKVTTNTNTQIKIKVYPNPTTDYVTIETSNPNISNPCIVQIYDISGRIIQTPVTSANSLNEQLSVDFSQVPSGQYFVRIISKKNEKIGTFSIIKR